MSRRNANSQSNSKQSKIERILTVARAYADNWNNDGGLTEEEIAKSLAMNRTDVSRLKTEAQKQGLLKMIVEPPADHVEVKRKRLKETLGLRDTRIVETFSTREFLREKLGLEAANYLMETIEDEMIVGIGWASTLSEIPKWLKHRKPKENPTVIPLVGGFAKEHIAYESNELARRVAKCFNGTWYALPCPAFIDEEKVYRALLDHELIKRIFDLAERSHVYVVGIGVLDNHCTAIGAEMLDIEQINALKQRGGVGMTCLRTFNRQGIQIPSSRHIIGVELSVLTKAAEEKRTVMAVAGGYEKAEAIIAAAQSGLINVLITDHRCAEHIFELTKDNKSVSSSRRR